MITLPPGFDLSGFVTDMSTLGALIVSISGILTAYYIMKKLGNKI